MASYSQRVHNPSDCALLLSIPVRQQEFLLGLDAGSNKDFAKDFQSRLPDVPAENVWDHYRKQAERILESARAVARLNCAVVESCTAADFAIALENYGVVALVAHVVNPGLPSRFEPGFDPRVLLGETKVEFADGLRQGEEFVSLIPPSFHGILDLRTCNSVILGESLKSQRRDFLVMENIERIFPVIQLIAFQHTIAMLSVYKRSYLQASQDARLELSSRT